MCVCIFIVVSVSLINIFLYRHLLIIKLQLVNKFLLIRYSHFIFGFKLYVAPDDMWCTFDNRLFTLLYYVDDDTDKTNIKWLYLIKII